MQDLFNLAKIYLEPTEKGYRWQYYPKKSLDLDEEESQIFGGDFRIEHQIVGTKNVIYTNWSQTMTAADKFSDDGVNALNAQLKKIPKDTETTLCFFNGTFPDWTTGGFVNEKNIEPFLQYIEYVLRNLGGKLDSFIIADEPNLEMYNDFTTFGKNISDKKSYEKAIDNLITAHIKAYRKIHEVGLMYGVDVNVGLSLHLRMFDTTKLLTKLKETETEALFQDEIYKALTTGEMPRGAEKFLFGRQRFYDFLAIKNFSLSDNVAKTINFKNFCEDANFVRYKSQFCKFCRKYFDIEDAPIFVLK